jgi:hypothetical protein
MGFRYFRNTDKELLMWKDISREQRLYCAELFFAIRMREKEFIDWILNNIELQDEVLNRLRQDANSQWEVAFEVCFYRDYIYKFGYEGDVKFPAKRTFDICLFSDRHIIIIEAKAQQGFKSDQLTEFLKDKNVRAQALFNNPIHPKVILFGLHSSQYSQSLKTKEYFDGMITWEMLSNSFAKANEQKSSFQRANSLYGN